MARLFQFTLPKICEGGLPSLAAERQFRVEQSFRAKLPLGLELLFRRDCEEGMLCRDKGWAAVS
jgi:hypothetical protein